MVRRASLLRLALLVMLGAGTFGGVAIASRAPLRLPGPAPQDRDEAFDAMDANRACEGCHVEIAAEWRGSLHQLAWDDPVFLAAYTIEPTPFCRSCHAPEADPDREASEDHRRLGVGCVTCHVASGQVVGVRARSSGPHAVRGDARMATAAACAGCHQFDFPTAQRAPMQGTVDEHRASPEARASCQSCHMKAVTGADGETHRRHDFRVDDAFLRSAVTASATRAGADTIEVKLAAENAGHAVPTGDMFRRLVVRAETTDGTAIATPVTLARRFVMVPGATGPQRLQVGDDRLPASGEPRDVRLVFDRSIAGDAVAWSVVYQRMEAGMSRSFGVDPRADEVTIAAGVLEVME